MKKLLWLGLLMGSLMGGSVYAANAMDQKIQEDQAQLKADYAMKLHHDLKVVNRKIKRLQHRTDADINKDLKEENRKLALQKAEVDRKLVALEKSTGDAWKDLRKGMDEALKDLKVSVDDASNRFKPTTTPVNK